MMGTSSALLHGTANHLAIQSSNEKWNVSPVCSRLREHISLLNGNSFKERIFLQSPMTNNLGWPMVSPALDPYRSYNLPSTAQNTSNQSYKQFSYCGGEGSSEGRMIRSFGESPCLSRKYMDQD